MTEFFSCEGKQKRSLTSNSSHQNLDSSSKKNYQLVSDEWLGKKNLEKNKKIFDIHNITNNNQPANNLSQDLIIQHQQMVFDDEDKTLDHLELDKMPIGNHGLKKLNQKSANDYDESEYTAIPDFKRVSQKEKEDALLISKQITKEEYDLDDQYSDDDKQPIISKKKNHKSTKSVGTEPLDPTNINNSKTLPNHNINNNNLPNSSEASFRSSNAKSENNNPRDFEHFKNNKKKNKSQINVNDLQNDKRSRHKSQQNFTRNHQSNSEYSYRNLHHKSSSRYNDYSKNHQNNRYHGRNYDSIPNSIQNDHQKQNSDLSTHELSNMSKNIQNRYEKSQKNMSVSDVLQNNQSDDHKKINEKSDSGQFLDVQKFDLNLIKKLENEIRLLKSNNQETSPNAYSCQSSSDVSHLSTSDYIVSQQDSSKNLQSSQTSNQIPQQSGSIQNSIPSIQQFGQNPIDNHNIAFMYQNGMFLPTSGLNPQQYLQQQQHHRQQQQQPFYVFSLPNGPYMYPPQPMMPIQFISRESMAFPPASMYYLPMAPNTKSKYFYNKNNNATLNGINGFNPSYNNYHGGPSSSNYKSRHHMGHKSNGYGHTNRISGFNHSHKFISDNNHMMRQYPNSYNSTYHQQQISTNNTMTSNSDKFSDNSNNYDQTFDNPSENSPTMTNQIQYDDNCTSTNNKNDNLIHKNSIANTS